MVVFVVNRCKDLCLFFFFFFFFFVGGVWLALVSYFLLFQNIYFSDNATSINNIFIKKYRSKYSTILNLLQILQKFKHYFMTF